MEVRIAQAADDGAIAEFLSRIVMPGQISFSGHYGDSFFSGLECEGYDPKVLVGISSGKIVGVGSITTRRVYLRGEPAEIGYLASLRLAPEVRGSTLLARGYRLLRELNTTELRLPFYLTSIMRSNSRAVRVLTSGKGGLPRYRLTGGFRTAVIPVYRSYGVPGGLDVVRGDEAGIDAVFHCFERYGRIKGFFPVHRREEWLNGAGSFRGMGPEDFLVGFKGGEPVCCAALWDQSRSRQLLVRTYSGAMRIAAMLDGAVGKITGAPWLPVPGKPFAPIYLSGVAVKDDDPDLFRPLLLAFLNRMHERKQRLMIAGFFENDRLGTVIDRFFHIPMYSNIYSVSWDDTPEAAPGTSGGYYLDVGSL